MFDFNDGMGGHARGKGGGTPEIERTLLISKTSGGGGGRYTLFTHRVDLQLQITERMGVMFGEPPHPLGEGWQEDLTPFPLKGRLNQVMHALTCACVGT